MYKGEYGEIHEIEVKKATDVFVYFEHGVKERRESTNCFYGESRDAVKQRMINKSLNLIQKYEELLVCERERLEKLKAL